MRKETFDEGAHAEQFPEMMRAGAEAEQPAGQASEQCVPLESLAMPGEDEKLNNPEVGDPVSYQVEGKVTRISGEMAYVAPATVNGKPVTPEAEATNDTSEDQDKAELYDMARERDSGAGQVMPPAQGGEA